MSHISKTVVVSTCALALALGVSSLSLAAKAPQWKGSIHVSGKHSDAQLQKMARISLADAEKRALGAVKVPAANKQLGNHEIEAENGYLVYSIEVKVKGHSGVEEMLIDAGNGNVLSHEHESPAAENGEAKGEAGEK